MSHSVDEAYDSYVETTHVARKEHRCSACKENILAGQSYARVYVLYDGEKETIKRCLRCQTLHEHLRDLSDHHELWPDEKLDCGEEYEEHWGHPAPEEIQRLAFLKQGEDPEQPIAPPVTP